MSAAGPWPATIRKRAEMADGAPLLEVEGVSKVFRVGGLFSRARLQAVKGVGFSMPGAPSVLALVGESGSGKTTLAKMVLQIEKPTTGAIRLEGDAIFAPDERPMPPDRLRRRVQSIAQLPIDAFSGLLPVEYYLRRTAVNLTSARTEQEIEERMQNALQRVSMSLERVAGKFPHQFSGGELQRISIARALIPSPVLIVADEPVSMVDASVRMNIINLFTEIKEAQGVSFLYVTHDLSTAHYLADDILIMKSGEIVERGKPRDVFGNPSHDYTRQLISSIPQIGERWEELQGGSPAAL